MADVKYKTGDEIRAAAAALNPKFNEFLRVQPLAAEYEAIDVTAPDANVQGRAVLEKAQPVYLELHKLFFDEVRPEAIDIIKSINAQPNYLGFNSERDQLLGLGSSINNLLEIADIQVGLLPKVGKATSQKIKDAQAAAAAPKEEPPKAEPAPPAATETAAQAVTATAPAAGGLAATNQTASPAAPAPNVPENQLSTSQKNNLVKSNANTGGKGASAPASTTKQTTAISNTGPSLGPGWDTYTPAQMQYIRSNLSLMGLNDRLLYAPLSADSKKRVDAALGTPSAKANIAKIETALKNAPTPPKAATTQEVAAPPAERPKTESSMDIIAPPVSVPGNLAPRPNPLHAYPSYTYGISLHMLTADTFNSIVDGKEYSATNVLIASAGKYNNQTEGKSAFKRNAMFSDDFYFDSLDMTTIIGHGDHNRATNAINVNFTIIEPYGLTLLDKIMAASIAMGVPNYLQNPYMLQIDFYGSDEEGQIINPIPNITKNIPIKLTACTAKVSVQGAQYNIKAIPFHHQAYDNTAVETMVTVEVTAKTVDGFFKSSRSEEFKLATEMNVDENNRNEVIANEARRQDLAAGPDGQGKAENMSLLATGTDARFNGVYNQDPIYKTESYADALNAHLNHMGNKRQAQYIDRYDFKFAEEIGTADLVDGAPAPQNAPMWGGLKDYSLAARSASGLNTNSLEKGSGITTIQAGDSIEAVIARVVRNSNYIRKQLIKIDEETNKATVEQLVKEKKEIPLRWFKIIPSVKLIGFDQTTNTFARLITYYVVPYLINNCVLPEAPKGKAKDPVKYYNFMYTGLNDDVIDLNLEFNALYYTAMTAYKSAYREIYGDSAGFYNDGKTCFAYIPPNAKTLQPTVIRYKTSDQRDINSIKAKTAEDITVADLERSITSEAGGDMIKVELTILGDPEFIKQDDVFYTPKTNDKGFIIINDEKVTVNGSIRTDGGEIYCQLMIKTPSDIDDETGNLKFGENGQVSGFSGLYRIHRVDNTFNKGKFIQKLTLIRQAEQEREQRAKETAAEERSPDTNVTKNDNADIAAATDAAPPAEKTAEAEDSGKAKTEPTPAVEPAPDPNAKDLANVRADGTTQTITSETAPATTSTLPKEVVATRELLSTQADAKTTEAAYDAAKAKYQVFKDQMNSKNPYQYLDDPNWRTQYQAAQDELNAAEDANKKAKATYGSSIQKLSIIRQGGS